MQLTVEQQEMLNHYMKLKDILRCDQLTDIGRCWVEMEIASMEREMGVRIERSDDGENNIQVIKATQL